jgi:hypothetical protein
MCMYLHMLRAGCVVFCLHVSRVERVCACVCTYQEPSVCLRVFARFESQTCHSMCMRTLRAESVAACV